MISYSNGKLKMDSRRSILDFAMDVSLLVLLCAVTVFGGTGRGTDYVYYVGFFFFVGLTVVKTILSGKGNINLQITYYVIWYGVFILLGIASSIWADYFSAVFVTTSRMLQIITLGICLKYYLKTQEDMHRLLNILMISFLVMTFFILIRTPVDEWFSGFVGKTATNFNTNNIGLSASIGTMIAFYEAYVLGKKRYFIAVIPPLALVVMTSSRKSLFMALAAMALIALLNTKSRNYLLRLLASLAVVTAVGVAVIKIPVLYRAVGVRLTSMYEYIMNKDLAADSSVNNRMRLIYMAKMFFYEHPIYGIGLNNFASRYTKSVTSVGYAHNNYWEIAADLGVIGLVAYYWFYIYLLVRHFKQILLGNKLSILFFSYVLILLFTEYGQVTYYDRLQQMMLALSFSVLFITGPETTAREMEENAADDAYAPGDYPGAAREER